MSFQLSVVTPEQAVLECEARSVVFPAHDGQTQKAGQVAGPASRR